ncbi:MAG: D-TA family PLP-dependent enzyme [Microscillaceae bacterium]|nr:D-TA family PLP-dependent enzyme [Microscillaceae bacterium]
MHPTWYTLDNQEDIESPALLLYPDRIAENIENCLKIAKIPERLRPHVKTHKIPALIRMHLDRGIRQFKCATLAEAQMIAETGGKDILIAYPLFGPSLRKFVRLMEQFPDCRFSTLIDQAASIQEWENHLTGSSFKVKLLVDIDCGMGRTGIQPGQKAFDLYQTVALSPSLMIGGLHVYDGHIRESSFEDRQKACALAFEPVKQLILQIEAAGLPLPEFICGGSPSFPVHAQFPERNLSPGTYIFWDQGYATLFPDMDFKTAAVILCRVISKPTENVLCLDLGHKAIASEMPHPRVHFFEIPIYEALSHSEEHLVISCPNAAQFAPGDCIYGIPTHICPTTALHEKVWIVENHQAQSTWTVTARKRLIDV